MCSLSNTLWEEHPDRIIINGGNSEGIRNCDEIVRRPLFLASHSMTCGSLPCRCGAGSQ